MIPSCHTPDNSSTSSSCQLSERLMTLFRPIYEKRQQAVLPYPYPHNTTQLVHPPITTSRVTQKCAVTLWVSTPHLQQYVSAVCLTWARASEHVVAAACARLGSDTVAPGTTKLLTLSTQSIAAITTTAAGRKHRPPCCLAMLPAASLLGSLLRAVCLLCELQ